MVDIVLKKDFKDRYGSLTDLDALIDYINLPQRKSLRINTIKISSKFLKKRLEEYLFFKQVPWCKEGFFVKRKQKFALGGLIEHSLGYFYIQEASSMLPAQVLLPDKNDLVLDVAAAPGSKTTQMAALMKNKGLIVANDIKYERLKALAINLTRMGVSNTVITLMHGLAFKTNKFDKILLDAPCSGTGTLRKSPQTLQIYNTSMITKLAKTQQRLIVGAFDNLKDSGTLVYSTCSLEPEENEGVIDYLLSQRKDAKLDKIKINVKSSKPIPDFKEKTYSPEIKKCLRVWPQDNNTDGFFVAKIKKD